MAFMFLNFPNLPPTGAEVDQVLTVDVEAVSSAGAEVAITFDLINRLEGLVCFRVN